MLGFAITASIDNQVRERGGKIMKTFSVFLGVGAFAFVAMAFQLGFFESTRFADAESKPENEQESAFIPFPEALAPACRFKPVAQAADYDPESHKPHPMVFLK